MDRSKISRALAKALAYKQCGKDNQAALWAAKLIHELELVEILHGNYAERAIVNANTEN